MNREPTLTEESAIAMRNAVKNGVIDTVLSPFGNPFVCALMGWVKGEVYEPQNPQTFEAWENPKSQRWQESVFQPIAQESTTEYWALELARFPVPKGSVGFVRFLDQVLYDAAGNYYPTNQFYWGSPYFVIDDVANCRWYLTLDYFDGTLPPRFTYSNTVAFGGEILPGHPYEDLHEIPAIWYPAHAPHNMKLIVPGNRMLRFFFFSPPTDVYRWVAGGRLAGFTQATYNPEATANARIL